MARQKQNSSSKCVVPTLDPWDQSILEYVLDDGSRPTQLACHDAKVQPELTFLDENVSVSERECVSNAERI